MFGILAKFFRFSGKENGNKFKLSMVIGLIEALASAMKIPAIMYILIGLLSGKPTGKYIGGSVAIMVLAIVVDVICKRYSTVLQTEGCAGYAYRGSRPWLGAGEGIHRHVRTHRSSSSQRSRSA